MLNLIKYELKNKISFVASIFALYLLEHAYIVGYKIKHSNMADFVLSSSININAIISILLVIAVLFFYNILNYGQLLNPKPGYMLFMTNNSKTKIILSKIAAMFIELIFFGILCISIYFLEFKSFDLIDKTSYFHGNFDMVFLAQAIFYMAVVFLSVVAVFMLAITMRKFLFNNKKLGGFITFVLAILIFIARNSFLKVLNLHPTASIANGKLEASLIFSDIIIIFIIFGAIIYFLEKRVDI